MMQKKDNSNLLKPKRAVEDFLDALLQESTEKPDALKPVRVERRLLLMPELEVKQKEPAAIASAEVEVKPEVHIEAVAAVEVQAQPRQKTETQDVNSVNYTFPLQCLMFSVADNLLSIPLINMGSVVPWGERLTKFPDSPDWFLGLMKYREQNIRVADSAKVLKIKPLAETILSGRHVLVFGDDSWAITCDRLGQVVYLNEADVQWSRQSTKGLSLGTIKQSLAMLLDPKKILDQLNRHGNQKIA